MSALVRLAAGLCLLLVTGCGETTFQDYFGAGKDVPDENLVRANQTLTMPPDLALKAPGTGTAPPAPPPVQRTAAVSVQPPSYDAPAPGTTTASLTPAQSAVSGTQSAALGAPPPAAPPAPPAGTGAPVALSGQPAAVSNDPYVRYGISKTRPDGKLKTASELRDELRKKYIEEQRAKNPNYGTLLNMGSVWSDQ